ncbi:MAG: TolC family protein [bacterium]
MSQLGGYRGFQLLRELLILLMMTGSITVPVAAAETAPGAGDLTRFATPDSAMAVILTRLVGEPLSLRDAISVALEQATAARIAAAELAAAQGVVRSEKGAFDPELFGQTIWSGSDQPTASFFSGADVLETERRDLEAGIRMNLKYGTELTAALNSSRLTTNSAFASLSPQYETAGVLSVRQPLLKGFGPSASEELTSAEFDVEAARQHHDSVLQNVRAAVEALYWELYTAERDYAVALLIHDQASAFLDETRLRVQTGLVGPNQVANARVFLAEQQQVVMDREEQLDRISDSLVTLLGRRPESGLVRFRPADEPPTRFPAVAQDSLVAVSIRANHDLQAMASSVEAIRARERGARWNALPTLDLFGSLGGNGLSGTPQDVIFPGFDEPLRTEVSGGFGESWTQVRHRDYPTWDIGFVFALPLGNRIEGGERDRLRAEVARAEQQLETARRSLAEQVRAQHRELVRGQHRLEIAAVGVDASNEQVRIGLLEFQNGRTTAFEVVRLAADLASAQQRYSRAMVRTARAAAELRRLTAGWYPDRFAQASE